MLCVWGGGWDWKRIVHYKLLLPSQTIDFNLYCQQLEKLHQAIERKRPKLINRKGVFHYDNAKSRTSLATRQKLKELSWKVLMPTLSVLTLHHQTTICFDQNSTELS